MSDYRCCFKLFGSGLKRLSPVATSLALVLFAASCGNVDLGEDPSTQVGDTTEDGALADSGISDIVDPGSDADPGTDDVVEVKDVVTEEDVPAAEDTPVAEDVPVAEDTPAPEDTPVGEDATDPEDAPVGGDAADDASGGDATTPDDGGGSKSTTVCDPCAANADCNKDGNAGAACVDQGANGNFCGIACTQGACPDGYVCKDVTDVEGAATKQCVPKPDAGAGDDTIGTCTCSDAAVAAGLSTACSNTANDADGNPIGTCLGKRTCSANGLSACDAATPAAETCDDIDNDCDGAKDEGTCDDGNICTDDKCDGANGCVNADNTAACDDGVTCTDKDACKDGKCGGEAKNCDDANVCTADSCDAATGDCAHTKDTGSDCDDGDGCTGGDKCGDGVCLAGASTDCNDDNVCTKDSCDPKTGKCVFAPGADGDACDDGSACTEKDACKAGACAGAAVVCDDKNPCTIDTCDVAAGCSSKPDDGAKCDDGDACTDTDVCTGGKCGGTAKDCDDKNGCTTDSCDKAAGCKNVNADGACDDGDLCTTDEACKDGKCGGGNAADCNDDDPCTTDACNKNSGECENTPTDGACNDGNPCTDNDVCTKGQCAGVAAVCDDNNACTKDSCDPEKGCVADPLSGPCDDDNLCTANDACKDGVCEGIKKPDGHCDDGNPCTSNSCHAKFGCLADINDGAKCEDGSKCTENDTCSNGECKPGKNTCQCQKDADCAAQSSPCDGTFVCKSGKCAKKAGTGLTCDKKGICFQQSCKAEGGSAKCINNPINDGQPCDDGSKCTLGDKCKGGVCAGGAKSNCDDKNPCTTDSCNPKDGCVHTPADAPCEDGSKCTVGDKCVDGKCAAGKPPVCNDKNPCTNDKCNPKTGCIYPHNNAVCDDGSKCTAGDKCKAGSCTPGAAKNCDDGKVCTTDSCDKASGACKHEKIPGCTGACKSNADCPQDKNPCTKASCDLKSGACKVAPFDGKCSDGLNCTIGDKCVLGKCKPGTPPNCDDKNACTSDYCDKNTGKCAHTAKPGCKPCTTVKNCFDGKPCTTDKCISGKCAWPAAPKTTQCSGKIAKTAYKCDGAKLSRRYGYGGCTGTSATTCSISSSYMHWKGWTLLKTCPSDTICTASKGTCVPKAKPCKISKDCNDGKLCTLNLCVSGKCAHPIAKKNSKCGIKPLQTQYMCSKNVLSRRYRYAGCTGISATLCSTSTSYSYWSPYSKIKTCSSSEVCDALKGICKPKPNICTSSSQCNDGKPCTKDVCVIPPGAKSGKCVWSPAKAKTKCGSKVVKTTYSCSSTLATVYRQQAYGGCTGKSTTTCSTSSSYLYWTGKSTYKKCGAGTVCQASTGTCKVIPTVCKTSSNCNDLKICTTDSCVSGKCVYKLAPKGTKCDSAIKKTEYKCSSTGTVVYRRLAYRGCTGTSSTYCSISSSNYNWTKWSTYKLCAKGTVCNAKSGACAPPASSCKVSSDCNDGKICTKDTCISGKCSYKVAAKGTKCSDSILTTEYKCSSTGLSVLKRTAHPGCTGISSTTCSTSSSYRAWSGWSTYKSCAKGYVCDLANKTCKKLPTVCKSSKDCNDGKSCTTDTCSLGKCLYKTAPKGTKCGTSLLKSEYKCIFNNLYKRDAYGGCTGLSTTSCSTSSSYMHWTSWKLTKVCGSTLVCSASAKTCVSKTCKSSKDCNDNKACTTDICSLGKCIYKTAPKGTKCDSAIKQTQYKCSTNKLQRRYAYRGCNGSSTTLCSNLTSNYHWTSWLTIKTCTPAQVCSSSAKTCLAKSCKSSSECNDGKACTADSCSSGKCKNTLLKKNTKCSTKIYKTEYKCTLNKLYRRYAYPGCTGLSTTLCSTSSSYLNWTSWLLYKSCTAAQVCSTSSKTCLAKACKSSASCNDGKVCTIDKCVSGKCSNTTAPKGTKCDSAIKKTEYKCSTNKLQRRYAYRGCPGTSGNYCSSLTSNYHWTSWATIKTCNAAQVCSSSAKTCVPKTCTLSSQCNDGKICTTDACVSKKCKNTLKTKGSKCGTKILKTEYKCSSTGKTVYRRYAYAGCNGSSTTLCSTSASYWSYTSWKTYKSCASGTVCDAKAGTCKPVVLKCTTSSQCNDGKACSVDKCVLGKCVYSNAPKGTKCDTAIKKTEYKCSTNKLQRRYAYRGCPGTSTSYCSSLTSNYHWTSWITIKTCNTAQVCSASSKTCLPKPCTSSSQCSDGKACTSDACVSKKCKNTLMKKNAKCSTKISKTEYKCTLNKLYRRYGYGGCTGLSTTLCSTSSSYMYWTSWALIKTCTSAQVCSTSSKTCLAKSCSSSSQCNDGKVCTIDKCLKGKCSNTTAPKGTKCDSAIKKTEYKCSTNKLQRRYAYRGCPGTSGNYCSSLTSNYHWTSWATIKTCNAAETCSASAKTCVAKACTSSSQCNDGKVCTTGSCVLKKCKQTLRSKNSKCGTKVVKSEYKCTSNKLYKRNAYGGCTGFSTTSCSTSSSYLYWTGWFWQKTCTPAQVCSSSSKTCLAKPCLLNSQCNDGRKCSIDKCVSNKCSNTTSPKGTKCGTSVLKTYYKCSSNKLQRRYAYAGCNGSSQTSCSTSSSYYHYTSWVTIKTCNPAQACSSSLKTCVAKSCTSSSQCNDGKVCTSDSCVSKKCSNKTSPKGTKCGKSVLKTEYKCYLGKYRQRRYAYAGCTGFSTTLCSSSSSYYYWTKWTTIQTCNPAQVCSTSTNTCVAKSCTSSSQCSDGKICTTDTCSSKKCKNTLKTKGTKCGTKVLKTAWRCTGSGSLTLQERKAYAGCTGWSTTTCSTSSTYYSWTSWKTINTCGSGSKCSSSVGLCYKSGSCKGSDCKYKAGKSCQCDSTCVNYDDCCIDKKTYCK